MSHPILLIEDDRELRAALTEALTVEGHEVLASASLADARARLRHAQPHAWPDLVLLDLGLPDGDGAAFLAEIRRASRYQKDLAVLMLDIDHFKQINDQHGHAAGDKVLIEFAGLCLQSIRETDLAGRYGGEEFFILLPEIDLATAILSADRIRMAVAAHPFTLNDGNSLNVTCSIGIAMYRPEQDDLDKLLLRADQALYQAKRQGRNRCCVQHHPYDAG